MHHVVPISPIFLRNVQMIKTSLSILSASVFLVFGAVAPAHAAVDVEAAKARANRPTAGRVTRESRHASFIDTATKPVGSLLNVS